MVGQGREDPNDSTPRPGSRDPISRIERLVPLHFKLSGDTSVVSADVASGSRIRSAEGIAWRADASSLSLEVPGRRVTLGHNLPRSIDLRQLLGHSLRVTLVDEVTSATRAGTTSRLTLADGSEVEAEAVLVATGRLRNVEGLGLERAGVRHDPRTGIAVNTRLQTSSPDIFAAGDVVSRLQLTHAADAQARVVVRNALFLGRARADELVIPWCTYTRPEIAHIGATRATLAQSARPFEALRAFRRCLSDWNGFSGQERFVHAQVDRAPQDGIGRHAVPLGDNEDIARDDFAPGDAPANTSPGDQCARAGKVA